MDVCSASYCGVFEGCNSLYLKVTMSEQELALLKPVVLENDDYNANEDTFVKELYRLITFTMVMKFL